MSVRRPRRTPVVWVLCGLLLLVGLAPAMAADRAAARKPAASWKAVRTENFSGSALPKGCGSYSGSYLGGASAWIAKDVTVAGGRLRLTLEKRTTGRQPYSSGGLGCWDWAQTYGRYEIRARVPAGQGIDSYLTLVPKDGAGSASTSVELLAPGPETAYLTNGDGRSSQHDQVVGTYAGAFHTYGIEWAPAHVRVSVDGREIFFSDRAYAGARWLGLVVSSGDALSGVPDSGTRLPAQFQIDQVRIWSYTGVRLPPHKVGSPPASPTSSPIATPVTATSTATGGLRGTTSPSSTPSASAASTGSAQVGALESVSASGERSLAGGLWPWLLGGSLIAAAAVGVLNYPRRNGQRRNDQRRNDQRRNDSRRRRG